MSQIKLKRGMKANLPSSLPLGEPAFCLDTQEMYVGQGKGKPLIKVNAQDFNEITSKLDKTNTQLSSKMEKGEEIVVSQINKNKGKLDQTYMTDEFLQQMTGNTPVNAVPATESVVTNMLAKNSVTSDKLDTSALTYTSEYFSSLAQLDTENCGVDFTTSSLIINNDSGVIEAGSYGAYYFKWYKGFKRGAKFSIKIPDVIVPEGAEIITRYRTANMNTYGPVKHKLKIVDNCAIITNMVFNEEEAHGIEVLFDNRRGAERMYFTKPEVYSGPLPINTYSVKIADIEKMLNKTNYIVGGNGDMTLTEMNEQKHPNCVELRVGDVSVVEEKFVIGNNKGRGYLFFFYNATEEFAPGKTISFLADIVDPCFESSVGIRFNDVSGNQIGEVEFASIIANKYVLESLLIPTGTKQINVRIDNRGTSKELVLANLKLFHGNTEHIELPEKVVNFNASSVKLNLYPDPNCKTNKYFNYTSAPTMETEVVPNGLKITNKSTTSFQACGYEFNNSTTESLLANINIGEVSNNMGPSDAIVIIFFKDGSELSRKKLNINGSGIYTTECSVPEGTNSIRLRFDVGAQNSYVVSGISLSMEETKLTNLVSRSQVTDMIARGGQGTASGTYYVSPTGSDENDGSVSKPLATVNKALEKGANFIYLYGGVYEQTIDLSKCNHPSLSISRFEFDREVTFTDANRVLCNTETQVPNYTKVYKATITPTLSSANIWIFQDSIPDESTLISDEERHPLQRGYEYRCPDTKIQKCSATTLDEALEEIERSNEYKWYVENGILYFSRPSSVNSINPICYSSGRNLFANPKGLELKVSGISTKYLAFNINTTLNSEIADCKASNVCGAGAFVYNSALNCKFIKCEASRCFNGSNGDGFNGHCNNTGDIYSKQLTATFIDCWSHDNNDDGYSDHERAESTFIGGLFEYNKKGGVTPSYGAHITCYNVLSRHNYCGFNYVGTVAEAEGGKYGQMICYNCVAENNIHGGEKAGFNVNGTKNTIKLINCKSLNNHTGYKASNDTNTVEMIDCSSYQDVNTKGGSGTFIIKNTTIVV